MDTKLTLKLDATIIKEAKGYAQKKQQSLSSLVEQYFRFLTINQESESQFPEISPTIKQLSGIITSSDSDKNKEEYTSFLEKKYSE